MCSEMTKATASQPQSAFAKSEGKKPRAKNAITAAVLLTFVGGVYYTAISKMNQTVRGPAITDAIF